MADELHADGHLFQDVDIMDPPADKQEEVFEDGGDEYRVDEEEEEPCTPAREAAAEEELAPSTPGRLPGSLLYGLSRDKPLIFGRARF